MTKILTHLTTFSDKEKFFYAPLSGRQHIAWKDVSYVFSKRGKCSRNESSTSDSKREGNCLALNSLLTQVQAPKCVIGKLQGF